VAVYIYIIPNTASTNTLFGNSLCCNVLGLYEFHKAEYIYIMLSFTAKTFLAADVFGGLKAAED
jgi:hypothetical protein